MRADIAHPIADQVAAVLFRGGKLLQFRFGHLPELLDRSPAQKDTLQDIPANLMRWHLQVATRQLVDIHPGIRVLRTSSFDLAHEQLDALCLRSKYPGLLCVLSSSLRLSEGSGIGVEHLHLRPGWHGPQGRDHRLGHALGLPGKHGHRQFPLAHPGLGHFETRRTGIGNDIGLKARDGDLSAYFGEARLLQEHPVNSLVHDDRDATHAAGQLLDILWGDLSKLFRGNASFVVLGAQAGGLVVILWDAQLLLADREAGRTHALLQVDKVLRLRRLDAGIGKFDV